MKKLKFRKTKKKVQKLLKIKIEKKDKKIKNFQIIYQD